MKKEFKIFNSFEEAEANEINYWASKTPSYRLKALERMRRLNFPGYDGNTANISRVYKVAKLQGS